MNDKSVQVYTRETNNIVYTTLQHEKVHKQKPADHDNRNGIFHRNPTSMSAPNILGQHHSKKTGFSSVPGLYGLFHKG
jgi:hypothetical protein